MNDAPDKIPQKPTMKTLTPHDLHHIAYEAAQQAARVRALVRGLAVAAGQDTNEELWFEALERLLDPLCDWNSTLCAELYTSPQPAEEGRP